VGRKVGTEYNHQNDPEMVGNDESAVNETGKKVLAFEEKRSISSGGWEKKTKEIKRPALSWRWGVKNMGTNRKVPPSFETQEKKKKKEKEVALNSPSARYIFGTNNGGRGGENQ